MKTSIFSHAMIPSNSHQRKARLCLNKRMSKIFKTRIFRPGDGARHSAVVQNDLFFRLKRLLLNLKTVPPWLQHHDLHSFNVLSKPVVTKLRLSLKISIPVTFPSCPCNCLSIFQLRLAHTLAVPSKDDETKYSPVRSNLSVVITLVWAGIAATANLLRRKSNNLMVPSSPAVAK